MQLLSGTPNRNAWANEGCEVRSTAFAVEMSFKALASRNSGDFDEGNEGIVS